jgi:DNA-binding response OmpR family regulator
MTNEESSRDRVLIIEGAVPWGKELVPAFKQAGFGVLHAQGTPETLLELDVFNPDIVILDEDATYSMGICHQYVSTGVPVILVGEDTSEEIWRKAVDEAGAETYLRKPVSCEVLIARVRAILRRYKRRKNQTGDGHSGLNRGAKK